MNKKPDSDVKSMNQIIHQKTFYLSDDYETIKERINSKLHKYMIYDGLFSFNDTERSVSFLTEELVPSFSQIRPHVMLLFSNPHPNSVYQGMFLSPNTLKQDSLFWPVMKESRWIDFTEEITPEHRAKACLLADYQGSFDLVFHCFYSFPTNYPEDIKQIFGKEFFAEQIEPCATNELIETINDTSIDAIVVFNKLIFNKISSVPVDKPITALNQKQLVTGDFNPGNRQIPVFLTYPTGWRYKKDFMPLRIASMQNIETAIIQRV